MENDRAKDYTFVKCSETPGGVSRSSADSSDGSNTRNNEQSVCGPSEQRTHARLSYSKDRMTEDDIGKDYTFVRCPETPGGVSRSSAYSSDGSNARSFELSVCSPSEQRTHAQHARHLPSRTLAILSQAKHEKIGNVASTIGYSTLRVPRTAHWPVEEHAENIASHMELHDDLMQDDPISEMRRIETLREMPQCLTVKRTIRAKLAISVNQKSKRKPLSYWKRLKYAISISFMKICIATREVSSSIELWYQAIRTIEGHFGSGVATYFKFLRWLFIMNLISCVLSICFIAVPQSLVKASENANFSAWDIFIGNGYLENTILYYGFYGNETIEVNPGYNYNIPSAYFLTLLCCYLFTFVLLSVKVARSYRKCYIETGGGIHNPYASKIFCGWDFGVASYKAADLCSASIYRELKELLAEANKRSRPRFIKRLGRFLYQCGMTILALSIMGAMGALLWELLFKHEAHESYPWSLLLVPFVITCIMNFFPAVISLMVKFEHYSSKRTALYVTMIRIYTMTAIVIGTLLVYWLSYSTHNCWQTNLAQEIYRLVVLDFVISIVGNFFAEALRHKLHALCWTRMGAPKFEIARNTLNLIYNQILFWVAFYFSPPLSLLIVVKMILTFYIKKFGLMRHCDPPSTPWRAAQTHTLFLALAFLGMTGVLVTIGYVITSVKSGGCGPFRNHDYTWEVVIDSVLNLRRDSGFWIVVTSLARPGTGAAILIAMFMTVYCLRAKAQASKELVHILREMLVLQSRDKDFLLKEFSKVADEHWLRRRTNFDLKRESSAAGLGQGIEMSEIPKGRSDVRTSKKEGIQGAGDQGSCGYLTHLGNPSSSRD